MKSSVHARFSAISRTYSYHISTVKNPFRHPFQYLLHVPLDVGLMNKGASLIRKYNDFTSFSCAASETSCFIRNLTNIGIKRENDEVVIDVRANAFLRSMVRVIVGTLVEVGLEKRPPKEMKQILEGRNRVLAGATAPACGLCLMEVEY